METAGALVDVLALGAVGIRRLRPDFVVVSYTSMTGAGDDGGTNGPRPDGYPCDRCQLRRRREFVISSDQP